MHTPSFAARSRLQAATGLQLLPAAPAEPLAWHLRKPLLAAADSADRVHIYNFAGRVPALGQPPAGDGPPAPLSPSQLLFHEFQHSVAALAWRPNSGACLAAACARGVCVWRLTVKGPLGGGGGARAEGAGGAGRMGASGGVGAWMTWLRPPAGAGALSCLAWHPRGHMLAAASQQGSGFFVWDVATGACTPVKVRERFFLMRKTPAMTCLLSYASQIREGTAQEAWSCQAALHLMMCLYSSTGPPSC
jgi:hypothetical protein